MTGSNIRDIINYINRKIETVELLSEERTALEIAKKMLNLGYPIDNVSKVTDLSVEFIKDSMKEETS